ncbi:uncharacterized protein LOC131149520 isoform X5 [Malania oleifera]|uniref:uncharacterized protein LOC131149520 isoform X5 n=1 Tax=Malania oleifera TaxID=397392 RepID=UPI0025ADF6DC|nr:uncharacterized protein LOC131149520 isoform X5 [Malania oleifera]
MQANPFPFVSSVFNQVLLNGDLSEGIESPRVLFFLSFLFAQGGGMDLSKVGEKILSSVRSARSLGLLPSTSDRPEVPARAAAAAAIARALAGLPPHQRHSLPSSSEELSSIYGSRPHGQVVEELEEDFYEEEFDPVRHVLEHIPSEENELAYFERQATLRLAQLDRIAERLSRHVMEHHEEMVKGMHLVRELEKDLKVANVICMNGRRYLTSSMHEVSRDLIVTSNSRKKKAFLEMLPILTELRHALDMQVALESHVEEGNYFKAFQVLSEYLQLLDSFSDLSAIQEMSRGVEVWLGKTLQKLDSLLLGVCQDFKEDSYITVVDAYALIGDVSGLGEKIQSFFMQEVLSETHSVLKNIVLEDHEAGMQNNRLTYSDLCLRIPESKFRQCLLRTLGVLFRLMSSYCAIMVFQPENKISFCEASSIKKVSSHISSCSGEVQPVNAVERNSDNSQLDNSLPSETVAEMSSSSHTEESASAITSADDTGIVGSTCADSPDQQNETRNNGTEASSSGSPWYQLRKDAAVFVSQTLQRGRKNLWQLTTSRVSVLLSSAAVCSTSIHQFLRNYEDLNIFILAGEAFCGVEAFDFRQKLKVVCENYFVAFHRQNICGICQLFEVFFHFVFETFGHHNTHPAGKGLPCSLNYRLKTALSRIAQDCDQWIKPQLVVSSSSSSPTALNSSFAHMDLMPTSPSSTAYSHLPGTSFSLKERCAGADTIFLVARILHRSKAHLQSMLLQNSVAIVEDFYRNLVDAVPDLIEQIHKTTGRLLLHINGYVDRIANAKWELRELGLEHNGYVDLLLGEFKHYKTRLVHGGIRKEVQDLLLEHGLDIVAETLIEGLSRVKKCTDEGRALMSLDLQVLINGLQHFISVNVKPKLQVVETFIKAYYLPETEYVHWARAHPEYSKNQITGLINLVATMKGWKRKTRLEVLEKIE